MKNQKQTILIPDHQEQQQSQNVKFQIEKKDILSQKSSIDYVSQQKYQQNTKINQINVGLAYFLDSQGQHRRFKNLSPQIFDKLTKILERKQVHLIGSAIRNKYLIKKQQKRCIIVAETQLLLALLKLLKLITKYDIQQFDVFDVYHCSIKFLKKDKSQFLHYIKHIQFQKLTKLSINGMGITNIQIFGYIQTPSIKIINFICNNIVTLKSLTKSKYKFLERISIQRNKLTRGVSSRLQVFQQNKNMINRNQNEQNLNEPQITQTLNEEQIVQDCPNFLLSYSALVNFQQLNLLPLSYLYELFKFQKKRRFICAPFEQIMQFDSFHHPFMQQDWYKKRKFFRNKNVSLRLKQNFKGITKCNL